MTPQEFDYIKRAVLAIESGQLPKREQVKVLKTMSQITDRSARDLQKKLGDELVDNLVA